MSVLNKQTRHSILRELPAGLIIISFFFFWLRAVNFNLSPIDLARLDVGLLINLPLALAISPTGIRLLKNLYAKPYSFFLIISYLVFTALHAATLITAYHLDTTGYYNYLLTIPALMGYYLWFPICTVMLAKLLFRQKNGEEIDGSVIIFTSILLIFSNAELIIYDLYLKKNIF